MQGLPDQGEALDARKKLGKVTSPGPHAGPVIIGPALGTCWYYGGTVSSIKSELWAGTERISPFQVTKYNTGQTLSIPKANRRHVVFCIIVISLVVFCSIVINYSYCQSE